MDKESDEESLVSSDEVWIDSVMNRVNSTQLMDQRKTPCTIFRVPEHIRQLDHAAYTAVFAAIGPFHRNCCKRSFTAYTKWQCVRHLLSRHRSLEHASQLLNKCLLELKNLDEKVRSCYSLKFPTRKVEDMAEVMLLDGCFIIYLMLSMSPRKESLIKKERKKKGIAKEREDEEVGMLEGEAIEEDVGKKRTECMIETREGEVVLYIDERDEKLEGPTIAGRFTPRLVVYDLLKLENQIPFFVIQLLFDHLKTCEDGQINLVDLALQLFRDIHPEESKSFKKKSPEEYHHLLHLFYSSRIPSKKPAESASRMNWNKAEVDPSRGSPTSALRWIPSATELDRAGMKFKRQEQTDSFLNIKFQKRKMKLTPLLCLRKLDIMLRSGQMEIPPLQIYDYTGPLFQNLIAFEQCYFDTEMYITIYALFMDCIIDQAEDVRLLHLEHILEHKLSNDQEVADLFNKLGRQIHYIPEKNYLIEEVNNFYEVKWHKTLAALRREYFGSPLATISMLAAAFLLLLTVVQTIFSVLSYFHSS